MINPRTILIFAISLLFLSCRKKINITEFSNFNGWQRIGSSEADIENICEFNGEIYVQGNLGLVSNFDNVKGVGKYNNDGVIEDIFLGHYLGAASISDAGVVSGGVTDLEVHKGHLYFAGNFKFYNPESVVIAEDLFYFDGTNYFQVPCNDGSSHVLIRDLESYNNELIVTGTFQANTYFQSNSIDRLKDGSFIGFQSLLNQRMSVANDGEIYSLGSWTSDIIQRWAGTSWEPIPHSSGSAERVVAYYNETLYLSGSRPLQKFDGTNWSDVDQFSGIINGTKIINGVLYVFGNKLAIDNIAQSNVISFDGASWKPIGNLSLEVRDLEFFNDQFHAGTNLGLYVYNK